jgi:hypothetical protein
MPNTYLKIGADLMRAANEAGSSEFAKQTAARSAKALKSSQVRNVKPGGMSVGVGTRATTYGLGPVGIAAGIGAAFIQNAIDKLNQSWDVADKSIERSTILHNRWLRQQQAKREVGANWQQFNKDWYSEYSDQAMTPDNESNLVFDMMNKIDERVKSKGLNRFGDDMSLALERHAQLQKVKDVATEQFYRLGRYFKIKPAGQENEKMEKE